MTSRSLQKTITKARKDATKALIEYVLTLEIEGPDAGTIAEKALDLVDQTIREVPRRSTSRSDLPRLLNAPLHELDPEVAAIVRIAKRSGIGNDPRWFVRFGEAIVDLQSRLKVEERTLQDLQRTRDPAAEDTRREVKKLQTTIRDATAFLEAYGPQK